MDPVTLLMLGARYAPLVISILSGTLNNDDLVKRLKDEAGPIADVLISAGSQLFPKAAPALAIVGGAIAAFDADYTKWLQKALNRIDNAGLAEDGVYGKMTRAAVEAFQTKHGLKIDGLAGNITSAAINSILQGALTKV